MRVSFHPGDAVGIISSWFVAIVEPGPEPLIPSLIELVDCPDGSFEQLVDVVAGQEIRRLPEFALASVDERSLRALVRGDFAVTFEREGGQDRIDGHGFHTWRELSIPVPVHGEIVSGTIGDRQIEHWATSGVVPAASIRVPSTDAVPGTGPASAPPEPLVSDGSVELGSPPEAEATEVATPCRDDLGNEHPRSDDPSNETLMPLDQLGATPPPTDQVEDEDPSEPDDRYADVWHTNLGGVEAAAVRAGGITPGPAPPSGVSGAASDPPPVEREGDHDGHTRTVASLMAGSGTPSAAGDRDIVGVPSSPCVNGHPNPPFAVACRRCLLPVRDTIEQVSRADAGVLVLPDGERIEVDRTIVVGRNPKAEGLFSGDPPRLVGLADEHDVSRTHVVIELSGWTATVTDQDSLNGTEVQLPGKPLEQLRAHTPMAIVVGTRIVLANEVVLKLEGD